MRLMHPTDIATFTIEIAGVTGTMRFYGSDKDCAAVVAAIDRRGLIVASILRLDAMTAGRAIEIVNSIQFPKPPEPEFDPIPDGEGKAKLDG